MGTALIQPTQRGASLGRLTGKMRLFVLEMLADPGMNASKAAKTAGYANPAQMATKLLHDDRIKAMLGKAQRLREDKIEIRAEDVLLYLKTLLFFNPTKYFSPSKDNSGAWNVTDLESLPDEIGMLIDGIKLKVIDLGDGKTSSHFEVQLVSKSVAASLLMKHLSVSKHEVKMGIDWDALYEPDKDDVDLIEEKIAQAGEV